MIKSSLWQVISCFLLLSCIHSLFQVKSTLPQWWFNHKPNMWILFLIILIKGKDTSIYSLFQKLFLHKSTKVIFFRDMQYINWSQHAFRFCSTFSTDLFVWLTTVCIMSNIWQINKGLNAKTRSVISVSLFIFKRSS